VTEQRRGGGRFPRQRAGKKSMRPPIMAGRAGKTSRNEHPDESGRCHLGIPTPTAGPGPRPRLGGPAEQWLLRKTRAFSCNVPQPEQAPLAGHGRTGATGYTIRACTAKSRAGHRLHETGRGSRRSPAWATEAFRCHGGERFCNTPPALLSERERG